MRSRSCRGIRGRILLPVLLAGVSGACTTLVERPVEPVVLAYGGAEGETGSYELEQTLRGRIAMGGMPQVLVIRISGRIDESVERVTADGKRILRTVYSFLPPEVNGMPMGGGGLPLGFDSLLVRAPSGEIEQLGSAAAMPGFLGIALRSLGVSFPIMPARAVVPGDTWEHEHEIPVPGGGGFVATAAGRFVRVAPSVSLPLSATVSEDAATSEMAAAETGREVVIEVTGDIKLKEAIAEAGLDEFALDYSGDTRFDAAAGKLIESSQNGTIRMKGRVNNISMSARVRFTTVLRRVEDSPREEVPGKE